MAKSRAEIQRAYRQRKKEREGEKYLERERQRIKKYYVPIEARSKKDKKARREKVRQQVRDHRIRKKLEKSQNESLLEQQEHENNKDDENGVSSTTNQKLIVKLPAISPKERTRKRVSRAVSKQYRQLEKLREENCALKRKNKTISKRLERIKKRGAEQSTMSVDKCKIKSLSSPRKRVAEDLKNAGVSPSKVPKIVKKSLLLGNVITEEINEARKSNGKEGRKVLANILCGKLMKKYKLKSLLNKFSGINRKSQLSSSKKCDQVPKQERRSSFRNKQRERIIQFLERDDNSRLLPGKNDKVTDNKVHIQKRVLNDSMGFLHMKYVSESSEKVSFSTFCRMRPKAVSLTRYITKNQCLCQKHQNMALTLKAIKACGVALPLNPDEYIRKLEENNSLLDEACDNLPEIVHHDQ